jgi:hypothetical protein
VKDFTLVPFGNALQNGEAMGLAFCDEFINGTGELQRYVHIVGAKFLYDVFDEDAGLPAATLRAGVLGDAAKRGSSISGFSR